MQRKYIVEGRGGGITGEIKHSYYKTKQIHRKSCHMLSCWVYLSTIDNAYPKIITIFIKGPLFRVFPRWGTFRNTNGGMGLQTKNQIFGLGTRGRPDVSSAVHRPVGGDEIRHPSPQSGHNSRCFLCGASFAQRNINSSGSHTTSSQSSRCQVAEKEERVSERVVPSVIARFYETTSKVSRSLLSAV